MELVHTEVENGITYKLSIEQDDTRVRGNALASGNNAEDKAYEDEIIARLDNGDTWAWANANVEASIELAGATFRGDDWLGANSYKDTAEFITPGGYYDDMKKVAYDALIETLKDADKRADAIREYLKANGHASSTDEA